jgi:type IV secretory pathway TrbL component
MSLLQLIVAIVLVGFLLWAINKYIPMQDKIKKILNVVVVIAVIVWLLSVFNLLGNLSTIRIGTHHG